ncbi:MAG: lysophospholipid acyltransferase family protein, partial [Alphaproteobacteria bacterium]
SVIISILVVLAPLPEKQRIYLCRFWAWGLLKIFGITLNVDGALYKNKHRPVIILSNHFGLAEILAIFQLYNVRFVAKAEMGAWGPFGWAMKRTGQILINRQRKDVGNHIDAVSSALEQRKNVAIFPEGTSSDATLLLPFKSALLRSLNKDNFTVPATIQPLVITYTKVSGKKATPEQRRMGSWGTEPIQEFLIEMASLPSAELTVKVLPSIDIDRPIDARALINEIQPDMNQEWAKLIK